MFTKVRKTITKFLVIAIISIVTIFGAMSFSNLFASTDDHYVVDVRKEKSTNKDNNIEVIEKIKRGTDNHFDPRELNYEVQLKNIAASETTETQVSILVDSSYSMEINDSDNLVNAKVKELAIGILENVTNSKVAISNNKERKLSMTSKSNDSTAKINEAVNKCIIGEGNSLAGGIENAVNSFTNSDQGYALKEYVIVFTDSTDDISEKLRQYSQEGIAIIIVSVDLTSNKYLNDDGTAISGQFYLLPSEIDTSELQETINVYEIEQIYTELNRKATNIALENFFSDEIKTYFNISNISVDKGTVENTQEGYRWTIDELKKQVTATLSYTITLKDNVEIDAGIIFSEICTNRKQSIVYRDYTGKLMELKGSDEREGTESTVIKISKGFDVKIHAVNEENLYLGVDGIELKVIAQDENGQKMLELVKTTDSNGDIVISSSEDGADILRRDGEVTFTVTRNRNIVKVGYADVSDTIVFTVKNNKVTRLLDWVDNQSGLTYNIQEAKRLVSVTMPITSQKMDLEIRVEELNNSDITISGAEFELIQPKLNNNYEMDVLQGTTDSSGTIHFEPTIMTKSGNYTYILRQISTQDGYDTTGLALITMHFNTDGRVDIEPTVQYNPNVKAERLSDDHVLITVGNENVQGDPIYFTINLVDSLDETVKLQGVTYLIKTTNSNNQSRTEYATTDENGQIKTKIYGTGLLLVDVTEQMPKTGYRADTKTKELTINKINGEVKVPQINPTEYVDKVDTGVNKDELILNLTSTKKVEQNIVDLTIVDSVETDVAVGKGIIYELVEIEQEKNENTGLLEEVEGTTYGPLVTDRKGEIKFVLDTGSQGNHIYELRVDIDSLPEEYDNSINRENIRFGLIFDEDGFIIGKFDVSAGNLQYTMDNSTLNNQSSIEYTASVKLMYELNISAITEFKINVKDYEDSTISIEGSSYDINIEWEVNGVIREKQISGRKTNSNGLITTYITKSNSVKISVKQVDANAGYKVDHTSEEIFIEYGSNGLISRMTQSPYDLGATNSDEPNMGADIDSTRQIVTYHHLNKKRTVEDTFVNLTVNLTTQEGLVAEKILEIESNTLKDKKGNKLDLIKLAKNGEIKIDYASYIEDLVNEETIQVPGIAVNGDEIVYDLQITTVKEDEPGNPNTTYTKQPGTTVQLRLIFRYTDDRVRLTNVETIYGNRLVQNKIFSSSSDVSEDKLGVFLGNISLKLYTDFDDIGNLALDFKKINPNGDYLVGGTYSIKVTNPDRSVIRTEKIITNGDSYEDIEIKGLYVNLGTIIEITEISSPIGYALNGDTEIFEVTQIDDLGRITLEHTSDAYEVSRLVLGDPIYETIAEGSIKTTYELTATDYELNIFSFGIVTKEIKEEGPEAIGGYKFKINTNRGAQAELTTKGRTKIILDENEQSENQEMKPVYAKVGGNIENDINVYTVTPVNTPDYYRPIGRKFDVIVAFTPTGEIDVNETINQNRLAAPTNGYGTLWNIISTEPAVPGKIAIEVIVQKQHTLTVKVKTFDRITNAEILTAKYTVQGYNALVLNGHGSREITVGYITESGIKNYTLLQTDIQNSYQKVSNLDFSIRYSNSEIEADNVRLVNPIDGETIEKTGTREITITRYAEPKVPFEILNEYYFDNTIKMVSSTFEVTSQRNGDSNQGSTNTSGIVGIYSDIFGTTDNEEVIYKIVNNAASKGYATVDDFYVKVKYNGNREIVSAKLTDQDGQEITDNRFVTVGFKKSSTFNSYNSNDKGIVDIKVRSYPEFNINIKNIDRTDETRVIAGTTYSVTSMYIQSDNTSVNFMSSSGITTGSDGLGTAHLNKTRINQVVEYTIKENSHASGYQTIGQDIKVRVTFDEDGYVENVELSDSSQANIAEVSMISPITDVKDNFKINLVLKNKPAVKINIFNTDRGDETIPVNGAKFTADSTYSGSSLTTGTASTNTAINGKSLITIDKTIDNSAIEYTIKELEHATDYQELGKDIKFIVRYDENGYVSDVTLGSGLEAIAEVSKIDPIANITDNFEINLKLRSKPVLRINITNIDRRDGVTLVNGAKYTIESSYSGGSLTAVQQETATSGLAVAKIYKTIDNTVITYDIKEKSPAAGYQSFGADVKLIVTYDQNGYVSDVVVDNSSNLNGIVKASKVSPIVNSVDNYTINLELKSNPILKFDITAEDTTDHTVKIDGLRFNMVGKEGNTIYSNSSATNVINTKGSPEISAVTGSIGTPGYTALYMDRTLDNKEMYYVINEVQKASGYDWNDSEIIVKVTYDGNGAISTVSIDRGGEFANVASYDSDLFSIQLEIYNDEIKEFGINLITEDIYDKEKRINDFEVEAWLTDPESTSYVSDGKYELLGDNKLKTGADRDNDGRPDIAYGEDYLSMGQYVEGASTRNLRLEIKNSPINGTKGYYSNTGYYEGNKFFPNTYYQNVSYKYLISVRFDDEGKIISASLQSGENSILGWLADNRYVDIKYVSGGYKLNITLKFYPMLKLNLQATDNYEAENQITQHINEDGTVSLEYNPTALPGSSFIVSTQRHLARTYHDEYVTAGYIGRGHYVYPYEPYAFGDIYEATNTLYVPIEANSTRKYYVYEYVEPTNYQQYRPKLIQRYEERLIAIISIKFDEYGEIIYNQSVERYSEQNGNISIVKPYKDEAGTGYLSHNNINEYNYYAKHVGDDSRNLDFYIGYALTTTINIQAVDDISGTPISSIMMTPLLNNTYFTNSYYQYTTDSYKTTNSNGEVKAKYWGASVPENVNKYIIGSSKIGNNYNGYLFPADMTSAAIGGKGSARDYYVELDVQYDEKGKISNVKSLGKDLWGDDNVREDITWDSKTGQIYIKMLYSRRFQTMFYKVDYDDVTTNYLNATFNVVSDKGLRESFSARQTVTLGKVYKDTTVKYTLSETQIPSGYYPIQDAIDFYVEFDKDGNIGRNSVTSVSDYFDVVNTSSSTRNINKTSPDLTINLKNKQALTLDLRVIDKYYKTDGLANVYLEVTNSKGDKASGNPQTDANGYATVIAGPVYKNETILYNIRQVTEVDGYFPNEEIIKLEVTYTGSGRIQEYKIIDGNEMVYEFDSSVSNNTRKINMKIVNMPKDIKIGLYKYDKTTGLPMPGIEFEVTAVDVNTGVKIEKTLKTESTGYIIDTIGTFESTQKGKTIKYTIHEKDIPQSYRGIEDIVYTIRYKNDGSLERMTQVANEDGDVSSVRPQAAIGAIKMFDGARVHMTVSIPNDNAFDIEIKDEDTRFSGLGISGTMYDVSVNGKTYTPSATDEDGISMVRNITENGDITIRIAERTIGDGYLSDIDNNVEIKLIKGTDVYSLDLDSTTDGYLDSKNAQIEKPITIKVDEERGKVIVTFKNKTQTDLHMIHKDAFTSQRLSDAKFEVVAQQIDDNEIPIGNIQTITTQGNDIVNKNGELYFNLEESPVSQIIKYTFTEITPPSDDYNLLTPLEMVVKFDQYGRIEKQKSNMGRRLLCTTEHGSNNCRSMYAIISDGDVPVSYSVKVVTEDVDTGRRINDSEIALNIVTETGEQALQNASTQASMQNSGSSVDRTKNLAMDGRMYTDNQIDAMATTPIIVERGLVYMDGIIQQGKVKIEVSEQQTAEGYTTGTQKHVGIVEIESTFITNEDSTGVQFNVIDNDGFRVITDEKNMQITIVILNESRINLELTTLQFQVDKTLPPVYIAGISYDVSAEIITATDSTDTELYETTPMTDTNGWTSQIVGKAYAGKTIVYTLHQNTPDGYNKIDDIQVEVQYDSKGNIRYSEMLSSEDNCYIDDTKTKDRTISLVVQNRKQLSNYIIYIEKHAKDTDNDIEAYGRLLPNAKYEITVEEQFGKESFTWVDITDENGEIHGLTFNGTGFITITIKELEAPKGYAADTLRYLRLYRDTDTGRWTEVDSNVNYKNPETSTEIDDNGNEIIRLIPVDEQLRDKFTIKVNKVSAETDKLIKDSRTQFKMELVQTDENEEITYFDLLGTANTDENGMLIMDDLCIPEYEGEYTLVITELKAPEGYSKLEEPIKIPVKIEKSEDGNNSIKSINLNEVDNVSLSSQLQKQVIPLNIKNEIADGLAEDEYMLDITKVDYDTDEPIENMAIFKVLLPEQAFEDDRVSVYTETKENLLGVGKLDYCYIEQDRDYNVRLTHMKLPTEESTLKYVFTEISAPKGYRTIKEDLELDIEFKMDEETGEMYIENIVSSNPEYLRINTQTPCDKDTRIEVDILNKKGSETEYRIHYDANDGANGVNTFDLPSDQLKEKDIDIDISVYKPIRDGYIFDGWTVLPDGEVKFQPGDKFTLNQDITLYAKWIEKLYLRSTEYLIGTGEDRGEWLPGKVSEYEEGDIYIKGIRPRLGRDMAVTKQKTEGTYIDEFILNLDTNADEIKVYIPEKDEAENIVLKEELTKEHPNKEGKGLIGTGMIVKLTKGTQQEIELTLIVRGDILNSESLIGDGKIQLWDITMVKSVTSRNIKKKCNEIEQQAIDYYLNGNASVIYNLTGIKNAYETKEIENIREEE